MIGLLRSIGTRNSVCRFAYSVWMDAKHFSHPHEIGQRFRTKLVHQPVAMHLYGDFAYAHLRRRLLVKQASNHKRHYLAFTFGKSFKPGL